MSLKKFKIFRKRNTKDQNNFPRFSKKNNSQLTHHLFLIHKTICNIETGELVLSCHQWNLLQKLPQQIFLSRLHLCIDHNSIKFRYQKQKLLLMRKVFHKILIYGWIIHHIAMILIKRRHMAHKIITNQDKTLEQQIYHSKAQHNINNLL